MPGERVRLHRGAAAALGEVVDRSPAVVGEIARHWHRAGDLPRALTTSVRAGKTYTRLRAFADAHAAYARVLELVEEVPHNLDLVQVRLRASEAAHLAGESETRARPARTSARRDHRPDPRGESRCAGRRDPLQGRQRRGSRSGLPRRPVPAPRGRAERAVGAGPRRDGAAGGRLVALRRGRAARGDRSTHGSGRRCPPRGGRRAQRAGHGGGFPRGSRRRGRPPAGGTGHRARGAGPAGPGLGVRQPQPCVRHGRPAG